MVTLGIYKLTLFYYLYVAYVLFIILPTLHWLLINYEKNPYRYINVLFLITVLNS